MESRPSLGSRRSKAVQRVSKRRKTNDSVCRRRVTWSMTLALDFKNLVYQRVYKRK